MGHGTVAAKKGEPVLGLELGDGEVFGIGPTRKNWDAEGGESTGHTWYGIEDYSGLLGGVFDPSAVIELEACHSAHVTYSKGTRSKSICLLRQFGAIRVTVKFTSHLYQSYRKPVSIR